MAITGLQTIQYGDRIVGGGTSYPIDGAIVPSKSHDQFQLTFNVMVRAGDVLELKDLSEDIENDFSKRDQDLTITIAGSSSWEYQNGSSILNTESSIVKSGDSETDTGRSRIYTITISGELPADSTSEAGLRDVSILAEHDLSRRQSVSMSGVYTSTTAGSAKQRYEDDFDARALAYLQLIDSSAAFELVDEKRTFDRNSPSQILEFSRQYQQVIANQGLGELDHPAILDHRVTFTDLSQHPGDARDNIYRLRRVVGSYDCTVDIEQSVDLAELIRSTIRPYIRENFLSEFLPNAWCIEDMRLGRDTTGSRLSVSIQFLYQSPGGGEVVDIAQSMGYRGQRDPDYTFIHSGDELEAYVDPGIAILERVWSRTVTAIGDETPTERLQRKVSSSGPVGPFDDRLGGAQGPDRSGLGPLVEDGWNLITNESTVSKQFVGDPETGQQIELTVLTETVVERFTKKPGTRTQGTPSPTTPSRPSSPTTGPRQ